MHPGDLVDNPLYQFHEILVYHQHLVLRVIDDVDNLFLEQSRINRMADRADTGDGVETFHVPMMVPGQGANHIAIGYPQACQSVGGLS